MDRSSAGVWINTEYYEQLINSLLNKSAVFDAAMAYYKTIMIETDSIKISNALCELELACEKAEEVERG